MSESVEALFNAEVAERDEDAENAEKKEEPRIERMGTKRIAASA